MRFFAVEFQRGLAPFHNCIIVSEHIHVFHTPTPYPIMVIPGKTTKRMLASAFGTSSLTRASVSTNSTRATSAPQFHSLLPGPPLSLMFSPQPSSVLSSFSLLTCFPLCESKAHTCQRSARSQGTSSLATGREAASPPRGMPRA